MKNEVFSKSLFEVKIDFGCDFDANLAPFWKDFGRPGRVWALLGASWRLLRRLGDFLGHQRAIWRRLKAS